MSSISIEKVAGSVNIAVDAMGGDRGPQEVARGVIAAAQQDSHHYFLVGDPDLLNPVLSASRPHPKNVEIVRASEVIEMREQPTTAFKRKPNASIVVAARLVKEKQADGLVSIGNTGAAMAVSMLTLGRIKGIDRPAIAAPIPTSKGTVVLLDAGATVDCDPNNLYEFAVMGTVYSEKIFGVERPRIGLLANGEESSKGNDLVKRTHALFQQAAIDNPHFDFVGNVEGRDVFRGAADVIVCDGFIGNVFLKTGEGTAEMLLQMLKNELTSSVWLRTLSAPLRPALRRVRKHIDYAEHGGAPLLGVNGICVIGHGRSGAYAIVNACRVAEQAIQQNMLETIRKRICLAPSPPPLV